MYYNVIALNYKECETTLDFIPLLVIAFILEFIDNGFGGGFGTIFSPLLIILGYDPRVVVPAILMSEMVSGLWGGAWHAKYHNINFKIVGLTLIGSIGAMVLATYVTGALLPTTLVKQVIGFLAVIMGIFVVAKTYIKKELTKLMGSKKYKWWQPSIMGALIGYQKGTSGGNYGPFSVTGYMVLGLPAAVAIGTTTLAEGIACAAGVALYSQITGIVLAVAIPITIGSFIADPVSAWVNNLMKNKLKPLSHSRIIGSVMILVGIVSLLKIFGFI